MTAPRAVPTLILTVVAAFLLFTFRPSPGKVNLGKPVAAAPTRKPTAPTARKPRARAKSQTQTITGDALQDPYGTVQVAVKMRAGRIVDVTPVAVPLDDSRSNAINSQAVPILRSEVLQAQSASIDVVSGATYTSEAYARSLQSALMRAQG